MASMGERRVITEEEAFKEYKASKVKGHIDSYTQSFMGISEEGLKELERVGRLDGVMERTPEFSYHRLILLLRDPDYPEAFRAPRRVPREELKAYVLVIGPNDLKKLKNKGYLDLITDWRWATLFTEKHRDGKQFFI